MKPYRLEIEDVAEVSGTLGQYLVELDLVSDSGDKTFYKNIVVDAINENYARQIAAIRIAEIMETDTTSLNALHGMRVLVDVKKGYMKWYANIVEKMDALRTDQEKLLTALVKEAQKSAEEGLDIKDMGIEVELDGYDGHLVYAIRTVSEEGSDDRLELKLLSVVPDEHEKFLGVYEYEWLSIYDFHSWAAETILSEIMESR